MSHMRVPDSAEYEQVQRALLSTMSASMAEANVYIERRSMVTARFADGQVVDMAVSRRAGSNARWIIPDRSFYRAFDQVDAPR